MPRVKTLVSLCLALLSCTALPSISAPQSHALPQKQQAFRDAMLRGNAAAALRILGRGGENSFATTIYRDQLEYRLPQMMEASRRCRDKDLQAGDAKTAMYCNGFVFSTAWILGNAKATFQALAWHREYGSAIWAKERPGKKFPQVFPAEDVAKLARSIPAYSVKLVPTGPVALPYIAVVTRGISPLDQETLDEETASTELPSRPVVRIGINGHPVDALIDTGDPRALIVSTSEAKALGLRSLVAGLPRSIDRFGQSPVPAAEAGWSLVATLALGPLRARNLMAIVIPDRYNVGNPGIRLGLPLLARFKIVEFEHSGMVLNAAALPCRHGLPITYASYPNLDGALVFPAIANGKPINAMIDTGSVDRLIIGPNLIPKADAEAAATNQRLQNWRSTYIRIRIAGSLSAEGAALLYAGLPKTVDADFGYPQPWLNSVRFDFPAMSVCLVSRKSTTPVEEGHSPSPGLIAFSRPTRSMPHRHESPFQIPKLRGMDMYPGDTVVDRYAPPPPPWLHVDIHCAIVDGNMYVDGTVTGNYGRPIPGAVIYQGRGDDVIGNETSSLSGQLHGIDPLTGDYVATPPQLSKFPLHCVTPAVKVGTPSHAARH